MKCRFGFCRCCIVGELEHGSFLGTCEGLAFIAILFRCIDLVRVEHENMGNLSFMHGSVLERCWTAAVGSEG